MADLENKMDRHVWQTLDRLMGKGGYAARESALEAWIGALEDASQVDHIEVPAIPPPDDDASGEGGEGGTVIIQVGSDLRHGLDKLVDEGGYATRDDALVAWIGALEGASSLDRVEVPAPTTPTAVGGDDGGVVIIQVQADLTGRMD